MSASNHTNNGIPVGIGYDSKNRAKSLMELSSISVSQVSATEYLGNFPTVGGVTELSGLSDVCDTAASDGQSLVWNGSEWCGSSVGGGGAVTGGPFVTVSENTPLSAAVEANADNTIASAIIIDANTAAITTNANNATASAIVIDSNTAAIGALNTRVDNTTTSAQELSAAIVINAGNTTASAIIIDANTAAITVNANAISDLTTSSQELSAAIVSNAGNIASNTADLSDKASLSSTVLQVFNGQIGFEGGIAPSSDTAATTANELVRFAEFDVNTVYLGEVAASTIALEGKVNTNAVNITDKASLSLLDPQTFLGKIFFANTGAPESAFAATLPEELIRKEEFDVNTSAITDLTVSSEALSAAIDDVAASTVSLSGYISDNEGSWGGDPVDLSDKASLSSTALQAFNGQISFGGASAPISNTAASKATDLVRFSEFSVNTTAISNLTTSSEGLSAVIDSNILSLGDKASLSSTSTQNFNGLIQFSGASPPASVNAAVAGVDLLRKSEFDADQLAQNALLVGFLLNYQPLADMVNYALSSTLNAYHNNYIHIQPTTVQNVGGAIGTVVAINWDTAALYENTDIFTHDHTTNSSRITVEDTARYSVKANVSTQNLDNNRFVGELYLRVNGATTVTRCKATSYSRGQGFDDEMQVHIDTEIDLTASDYIEVLHEVQDRDTANTTNTVVASCEVIVRKINFY